MNRYLGFCPGRYGDLYIQTVAARILKTLEPDCHLTYAIGSSYREAAPLFINHPHIDRIHVLSEEDDFDDVDHRWIATQGFTHVFNPKQDHDHSRPWYKERHQTIESAFMHGLQIPTGETGQIKMDRWFGSHSSGLDNAVAFAPFPAFYAGIDNNKAISKARAEEIVAYIKSKGYDVLQVGSPLEPQLKGVAKPATGYMESVANTLDCRAFIGCDSGMTWLMSGYEHPTLALYGDAYYGSDFVRNVQPLNRNALYLSAPTMGEIPLDSVFNSIDTLLS